MTFCDRADMFQNKMKTRLRLNPTRATLLCLPRSTATTTEVFMTEAQMAPQIASVSHFYVVAHRPTTEEWGYLLMDKLGFTWDEHKRGYTIKKSDCVGELPPVVKADVSFKGYPVIGEIPRWDPSWMYDRLHLYSYLLPRAHFFQAPAKYHYLLHLDTPEAVEKDAITYAYTASVLGHHDREFWLACEEGLMKHRLRTCLLNHATPVTSAGLLPLGNAPINVKKYMLSEMERYSEQIVPPPPPPPPINRFTEALKVIPTCLQSVQAIVDMEDIVPPFSEYFNVFDPFIHLQIPSEDVAAALKSKSKSAVLLVDQYNRSLINWKNKKATGVARPCTGCNTMVKKGFCSFGSDEKKVKAYKTQCVETLAKVDRRISVLDLSPLTFLFVRSK